MRTTEWPCVGACGAVFGDLESYCEHTASCEQYCELLNRVMIQNLPFLGGRARMITG
jgi:hypothetical protein